MADEGSTLRVRVTAANASGPGVAVTSDQSGVVEAPPLAVPVNSVPPAISGTAQVGQSLTSSTGTWSGSPTSYAYQWSRCNSGGASCVDLGGATSPSYLLVAADEGATLRVRVTAANASGPGVAVTSDQSGVVAAPPLSVPVNSVLPAITGTAQVGQSLTSSTGTWSGSPTSYAYQWSRCNSSGASCVDLGGATNPSYLLVAADEGATLRVRVTAANASGPGVAVTSAQSGVVTAASVSPPPSGGGGGGGGGGGAAADLYLTGSAGPASVPVGGTITWRLRVLDDRNYAAATGVYVDVTMPAGVQVVSATTDRGPGCTSTGTGKLRCNLDWLSGDAPVGNITIVSNVTSVGELVLTAAAAHSRADGNPADNTLTLKANTPPPVGPAPPKPPVIVQPVFGQPQTLPKRAVAGKRFVFAVTVKRSDTGARLTTGRMVAHPILAGKVVKHVESFKAGKVRLSFALPKAAKGKLLRVRITITTGRQTATHVYTTRVR